MALVLQLWPTWHGSFRDFGQMLRTEHRLPHGDTWIGNCLQAAGLRYRKMRQPVEAPWSHDTFRTLFPGAQWLGDGTTLAMRWNGQVFAFNVEAMLDPASNAMVGFAVTHAEDEEAVRRAFEMGLVTTGEPPLALSLDNRPSNHSPATMAALAGTVLLRSTPGRGQAKAPLEGAFGLFQQAMPPLVLHGQNPREFARNTLELLLTAWFLGRNRKPRKNLGGLTPAQVYAERRPTPEAILEAMAWLQELARRRARADLTLEARRDPVRLALLTQGLLELGLKDPDALLARDLAIYAREAIARGLATFAAKQELGTVPPDADPRRYLGGIIRQLHIRMELERTGEFLLQQRLRMKDLTMAPLERTADQLLARTPLADRPWALLDRALDAANLIDFRFWTMAMTKALEALPAHQRAALRPHLIRRAAASFTTDRERRADLVDRITELAVA